MPKRITITDVARASGVSVGTVSRVLNARDGEIRISASTRQHVLKTAEELGYQRNVLATALRTERTNVIGAVVRNVQEPLLGKLIQEIQSAAHENGLDLLIGHAGYSLETAERQLRLMSSQLFDGLLIIGHMPGDDALFQQLLSQQTPFVAVTRGTQTITPLVNVDEALGTRMALDYLYDLGHRRIAFIGSLQMAGVAERLQAFEQFAHDRQLEIPTDYIRTGAIDRVAAIEAITPLVHLQPRPTAIFCAADTLAIGAMTGLNKMNLRVPADISVVGFDDINEGTSYFPALTTVHQPVDQMACEAVGLLQQMITENADRRALNQRRIILEPSLVIRESAAPPLTRESAP